VEQPLRTGCGIEGLIAWRNGQRYDIGPVDCVPVEVRVGQVDIVFAGRTGFKAAAVCEAEKYTPGHRRWLLIEFMEEQSL